MLQSLKNNKHQKKIWKWVGPGPFWIENRKLENKTEKKSLMIIYFWVILSKYCLKTALLNVHQVGD